MKNTKCYSKFNILAYALCFIAITSIVNSYGTIIPFCIGAFYCLINFSIVMRCLNKIEKCILIFIIFLLVLSFIEILINNSLNVLPRLNGILTFISYYLCFKVFWVGCLKYNNNLFIFCKRFYIFVTLVLIPVFFLQLVYIYLYKSDILLSILSFINPSSRQFLNVGRVCLLDSEPSFLGFDYYAIIFPILCYLIRKRYHVKRVFLTLFIVFLSGIFSYSVRFVIDSFVFVALLMLINYKIIMKHKVSFLFGCSLFLLVCFIFRNNITPLVDRVFTSISNRNNDYSSSVRFQLLSSSLKGFLNHPLLGNGLGNSYLVFSEFYTPLPIYNSNLEYLTIMNEPSSSSFSFYFTIICECGFAGIVLIVLVLFFLFGNKKNKDVLLLALFVSYSLLQMEFLGSIKLALTLVLLNYIFNIKKVKKTDNNKIESILIIQKEQILGDPQKIYQKKKGEQLNLS